MKKGIKIIDHIEVAFLKMEKAGSFDIIKGELKDDLWVIGKYLNCTQEESFFVALILSSQITNNSTDTNTLSSYLGVSQFRLIELEDVINSLINRNFIYKDRTRSHRIRSGSSYELKINNGLLKTIISNEPFDESLVKSISSDIEWVERVVQFVEDEMDELDAYEVRKEYEYFCNMFPEGKLYKYIKKSKADLKDELLLILTLWENYTQDPYYCPDNFFRKAGISKLKQYNMIKSIKDGKHVFVKRDLLDYKPARFAEDIELRVSDKFIKYLKKCDIHIETSQKGDSTGIKPEDIHFKALYYNEKEQRLLDTIERSLENDKFKALQNRLAEKGMATGITALFFGVPGTGKTESVLQLAKKTGREIIQVDISKTKSMWFGQSEKVVKSIFTKYNKEIEDSDKTPILLINEADAILGTRKKGKGSSVDQTENTIQNILLEEMEKCKGILIATTNLEVNLDPAFDRRFLFKVKFEKPGLEQRHNIWKDRISSLPSSTIQTVAFNYELSGGQIDNIIRKSEINYVLNNQELTEEDVMKYCSDELALNRTNGNKIGFHSNERY